MLNETFVYAIGDQAVSASGVQVLPSSDAERGRFLRLYDRDRHTIDALRFEPAARRDTVQRPEDVVAVVKRRINEAQGLKAEVFVGDAAIVGVFTESSGHREESVTMPLHVNPAFSTLMEIANAEEVAWLSHGAFVELLRVDLAGCVNPSDMNIWKRLRFSQASAGASNIKVGNESMDRSVQLGTTTEGGAEIPEFIEFRLPVYDECATIEAAVGGDEVELRRWKVTCAIAVDTVNQKFAIRPMTDELERARREAKQWLIGKLAGVPEGVLVVTGEPG